MGVGKVGAEGGGGGIGRWKGRESGQVSGGRRKVWGVGIQDGKSLVKIIFHVEPSCFLARELHGQSKRSSGITCSLPLPYSCPQVAVFTVHDLVISLSRSRFRGGRPHT